MELPEILSELRKGNRPKSYRYRRMAESHYLTTAELWTTKIMLRVFQVTLYGSMLYLLIHILT
jgi:hypothetical protein